MRDLLETSCDYEVVRVAKEFLHPPTSLSWTMISGPIEGAACVALLSHSSSCVRLPKLQLRSIGGNLTKWMSVWISFKGESHAFYQNFKFAIFVLFLMPTVWKKYSNIFSRFSFHCNPREKLSDN